jgi:hypothetical protein
MRYAEATGIVDPRTVQIILGAYQWLSSGAGLPIDPAKGVPQPTVTDPYLANVVKDMYKGARMPNPIGTGSTADAIRYEISTGKQVGGTYHKLKGTQYSNGLVRWLRDNPNASATNRIAAQSILDDLRAAIASGKHPTDK